MRVEIRAAVVDDAEALQRLVVAQRSFLEPFEPDRAQSWWTIEGQRARLADAARRRAERTGLLFLITVDGAVVGVVNLSNVVHGSFGSADLGYWVAREWNGLGVATRAVGLAIEEGCQGFRLHRVQAGTLLDNAASQIVLCRNGFRQIGVARRYLWIGGAWRDHVLFERLADEPAPITAALPRAIAVRPARLADARALATLVNGAARELPRTLLSEGLLSARGERRRLRELAGGSGVVFVASRNGEVLGRLDLWRDAHPNARHAAEVGVVVAATARRSGVGAALIDAALEWCAAGGVRRLEASVFVANAPSLAFFRRFGFVDEGLRSGRFELAGDLIDVIVLARRLEA